MLPRQGEGAGARLHPVHLRWGSRNSFGQHLMRYVNEIIALDDHAIRHPAEKTLPATAVRARRAAVLHDAGARRQPSGHRAAHRSHRLRPVPLPAGRMGLRRALRVCPLRRLSCLARNRPPSSPAARSQISNASSGSSSPIRPPPRRRCRRTKSDWVELPLIDLCPMLKKSPGVDVVVVDPGRMADVHGDQSPEPSVRQPEGPPGHPARPRPAGLRGCRQSAIRRNSPSFLPACSPRPCRWPTPQDWSA